MNAKLAVAISLGASSLALFGMANVANAETATTTDTGANPPVVKPSNDNPVEKAKGEAQKAVDDATEQKSKIDEDVNKAESEAIDANTEATNANDAVNKAQTELENKRKEAKTAEEQKTASDKELSDQKTAVDNADKEVKATQAAFDKETANQTAAENKLNKTKDEKGKVEGELNTEKEAVKAKETEQTKAGEKVKTEQGKLDTANTQLEKAKKDKKQAQEKANQLSDAATQKENEHKAAEQAVKENTQHQENIQKQIDNLNAAGSGTTSTEVQELKNKAEKAKQDYDSAQSEADSKAQEATNANNAITPKEQELNNAETALKGNENYKNNIASFDKAADEATKKYNEEYNKAKLDPEVEKGFEGFLEYIISTEKAKTDGSRNNDLIADAERAQKILKGETFKSTYTEIKIGNDTYHNTVEDMKAPIWADYVKKLRRVGGADSLQNLKEAATYYDALNKVRSEENAKLPKVGVRLSLIAESIIHSFYSASVPGHAANFDMEHNVNPNSPEQLKSHAYDDSSENLAWGEFDGNDSSRTMNKKGTMSLDINNTSNIVHSSTKSNAMDGWYYNEKDIYDNTLSSNSFGGKTLTAEGKTFLQQHRYDFLDYASAGLSPTLFNDDSDKSVQAKFKHAVGHYLNFVSSNNTAAGFAEADTAIKNTSYTVTETSSNGTQKTYNQNGTLIYDVAVWHGNSEKTISVDTYKNLLNSYINKVTDNGKKKLEPAKSRNLADLAAEENVANIKLFDSVYKVITAESNNSQTGANTVTELIKKVITAKKNFEKARDNASAANKAKEEAAKKAAELQTAWTTAQQKYEAAEQAATQASQESKEKRDQQIQQLQNDLNGLIAKAVTLKSQAETAKQTAKTARTAAKAQQEKVDVEFTKDVNEAQVRFDTATKAVKEANANKAKVDKELQAANEKVNGLTKKIGELTTQIESENQKVENAKSEVQAAQVALQGAKDTQNTVTTQLKALQTKAQNADETVKNTKAAVEVAKKAVVEKIKLAQTAVTNAQAKVQHAKEVAEAAKTKIETIKKNLATKQVALAATITDTSAKAQLNSIFMSATGEFESFVQILTGKVSTLQTTATNLTKSATALNDQLQKVAPESVVTPPVVPPAPKPPVVVPSHDGESGHGSTGNTGNTNNTGNTENAGNTGNSNVPFTPQAPHVSVPAVDVEQQSNEFASATAENHVTQAVAKSEAGKPTKAERANAKNTKHSNHTASANAAATSSAGVAQSKNAKDSKNAESKESAKKDSAKQETQDSNNNSSDQNSATNNTPSNESKNAQANGSASKAQNGSNNTLTIGAVVAVVIAGIVAIGGGVTFARHRRM